ncbi:MAG: aquaporin [Ilumatobacteraceae bacterium]
MLVGHASGAHLNPAVSIGLVLARKIPGNALPFYLIGQFLGAFIGAAGGVGVASGIDQFDATNNFRRTVRRPQPDRLRHRAIIVVEVISLRCGSRSYRRPSTRTSHPVWSCSRSAGWSPSSTSSRCRSTTPDRTRPEPKATAIFAGGDALRQVWAFILFPLIGAAVGVLIWLAVDDARLEGTLLFNPGLAQARDLADRPSTRSSRRSRDVEKRLTAGAAAAARGPASVEGSTS